MAFIMETPPIPLGLRLEPQYQEEVPVISLGSNKTVEEEIRYELDFRSKLKLK